MEALYIFLDEGGNFDFSPKGTAYFTLTSVTRRRPFRLNNMLDDYKYDLLEFPLDQEYFHCADDNSFVKKGVFDRISKMIAGLRIDSLIVEKRKTGPALQDEKRFYPEMLGYLLRYVLKRENQQHIDEIIVITDSIPLAKKRKAIEKAIKQVLAHMLPNDCKYRVLHHASKSHYGLQIADYCNWAIYRKWNTAETEFYNQIKPAITSEFEIFRNGGTTYY